MGNNRVKERPVSDVGEWALIEAIRAHLKSPPEAEVWSGDDAAVLCSPTEKIVFTTDALVENVDFDLTYSPPDAVGRKAIAVNASDVAAMGARPWRAVATLTLPGSTPLRIVDQLARGMARAAESVGAALVGGDVSEGRELNVSIAMIGRLEGPAITRDGARAGDLICVTGSLGGAAAGLLLLRRGDVNGGAERRLVERQLSPRARTPEGPLIAAHATAMIDVSDGLASDLAHVLEASGVGCHIDPARIPIDEDIATTALEAEPLDLALAGGEDFELLFTVGSGDVAAVRQALDAIGTPLSVLGEITETGRTLGDRNLDAWKEKGWEHLRRP